MVIGHIVEEIFSTPEFSRLNSNSIPFLNSFPHLNSYSPFAHRQMKGNKDAKRLLI